MTSAATAAVTAELTMISPDGVEQQFLFDRWPVLIGKSKGCSVTLAGWRAGREHARLSIKDRDIWLEDLGSLAGTWINGARIVRHGPLHFADEIQIAGYRLRLMPEHTFSGRNARKESSDDALPHASNYQTESRAASLNWIHSGIDFAQRSTESTDVQMPTAAAANEPLQAVASASKTSQSSAMFAWRQKVHDLLLQTIDLRRRDLVRMTDAELRQESESLIREIVARHSKEIPSNVDQNVLTTAVLHEAVGLGPLEDLLADPEITEIMVNRFDEVFIEKGGRLLRHGVSFTSDRAVLGIIERVVTPLGRRIDESSPMVDARLKDGSRVNAIIPPLSIKGPSITIRKFSAKKLQPEDLVGYGSISKPMVNFLKTCVEYRKNIIVSGGTGSGKTTFLNVLSNFIPNGERIVTVEDAAELRLNHVHLVSLEARPSNAEGRGAVAIRDLVRNCLRMRPDRIVVGECRGGEALDMLQAMNTGHEGSLTTLHANTPRDGVARLETMVLMSGMDLPLQAIREQIASAVDVIVQQTRFPCGARKVTSITEVCGMENGRIQLLELFKFERRGRDAEGRVMGRYTNCGVVPTFLDDLREQGAPIDVDIFSEAHA